MRRVYVFLFFISSCILLCANSAYAAEQKAEKTVPFKTIKAGAEVKTEFFKIRIPAGWMMPQPIKNRTRAISAVFSNERQDVVVTFNVMHAGLATEEFAKGALENMHRGEIKTSGIRKQGEFSRIEITAPIKGEGWFICKEGLCSATMLMGGKARDAAPLFKALDTSRPYLFPMP